MVRVVFGSIPSSNCLRDKISLSQIVSLELHLAHPQIKVLYKWVKVLRVLNWVGSTSTFTIHWKQHDTHSVEYALLFVANLYTVHVNWTFLCISACGFTSCHSEVFDCAVLHVVQFFWVFLQGYMQDPRKHYILHNSTVRREEAQQEANVEEVVQIETSTQSSRFVTLQSEDKPHRHICHMSQGKQPVNIDRLDFRFLD